MSSSTDTGPECMPDAHSGRPNVESEEREMYATVRRYEGIDEARIEEIAAKVNTTLVPTLRDLPGFDGYFLIDAGKGVLASVSVFQTAGEAHASTRAAASWVREQSLEDALPNTPTITAGPVVATAQPVTNAAVADGVATAA